MIAIFAALFWYIGVDSLYNALLHIKVEYLILAFVCYFGINLLFTVRLRRVLAKEGIQTTFGKTLLAQYAGKLTSYVTPGRSGYILTPLYRPKRPHLQKPLSHPRHPNNRVPRKSRRRHRRRGFSAPSCASS
jgi:uncharacterized membrane protein YbhN (UPF0104 family)